MKINKIKKSRLETVDFNNLPFGSIFSDHMLICEFKNGKWNEPEIRPYGPLKLSPGTQAPVSYTHLTLPTKDSV